MLAMVNQQLLSYIKNQLAAGVNKIDLQKTIAGAGWSAQDIADTFAAAEGRMPPPPPAPAPAPMAPTPQRPPAMPAMAAAPAATITPHMPKKRRMWPWVILAIVVLLAAGAAAAYLYVPAVQDTLGQYLGAVSPAPTLQPVTEQPQAQQPPVASTTDQTASSTATTTVQTATSTGATASTTLQ